MTKTLWQLIGTWPTLIPIERPSQPCAGCSKDEVIEMLERAADAIP